MQAGERDVPCRAMGAGRIRHDHQAGSAEAALALLRLVLLTVGSLQYT